MFSYNFLKLIIILFYFHTTMKINQNLSYQLKIPNDY